MINPLRVASDGYLRTSTIAVSTRGYIFIGGGTPYNPDGGGGKPIKRKRRDPEKDNNEMLLLIDIFARIIS